MTDRIGARIHVDGIVQGVGFRPFVYNLASRLALTGWVRNTSAGVDITIDGTKEKLVDFLRNLRVEAPPLAHIDAIHFEYTEPNGYPSFEIIHSEVVSDAYQPISPDVSICPDCLKELFDPKDRRYLYPFINCTNCGPRFTIITDIPYDRPNTTMASFPMCPDCTLEYHDPMDRRFHAQPVACPVCGPHVWLEMAVESPGYQRGSVEIDDSIVAIIIAQQVLMEGKILAIKGLGGFHLACDASNPRAVQELRRRKLRVDKPFALMMPDIPAIARECWLTPDTEIVLSSYERPIVILPRRSEATIAMEVAPGQNTLGVMLPYTPLHYLLFASLPGGPTQPPQMLVMTSGNLSEEPIAIDNDEARQRLKPLADGFLIHNRPIHTRCDDSVVRVLDTEADRRSSIYPIRRSRGYTPFPVYLPWKTPPLLAVGGELKNTFCLARDHYAFLSHFVGDMENFETFQSFEAGIQQFERLFRIHPDHLVHDLHPNYLSSRYAQERAQRENLPTIPVQHHHAHIASCMVEHGLVSGTPVIGIALDGTGYGEDGEIWGGEFLHADYSGYQRFYHLKYMPLPGGDASIRKPSRIALAYLWKLGIEWDPALPCTDALCADDRNLLRSQLVHNIHTPMTSSAGRLFDAISALIGVRQTTNYEGQAAIELEALSDSDEQGIYPFPFKDHTPEMGQSLEIELAPCFQEVLADFYRGTPKAIISARFHNGLAALIEHVCNEIHESTGTSTVALSGGVWQNIFLLKETLRRLDAGGFKVLVHSKVPANDGGIALGQAVIAFNRLYL